MTPSPSRRLPPRVLVAALLLQVVIVVVLSTILLEVLVALSFRFPQWSPIPISLVQYLHIRFDRNVIQVMPACAVYDEQVTYTLRPGSCIFASREFSNEYRINSLGVRDDEASLAQPHTVMLGDSLTMGWGVEQDETFAQVFEGRTRKRTLNAGVSSYGTVRELRLLERVDTSALRNLVIQYTDNDALENLRFIESPSFTTLTREQYLRTMDDQARLLRYIPGKYVFNVFVQLQSMVRRRLGMSREPGTMSVDKQAELFVKVVEQSRVDLSPFRVTVLAVDAPFIEALHRLAPTSQVAWVRRLEFVEASSITRLNGAFYTLDDHPTAIGHEALARLLIEHLAEDK
jgi:lysophospholipase L1-like esterase